MKLRTVLLACVVVLVVPLLVLGGCTFGVVAILAGQAATASTSGGKCVPDDIDETLEVETSEGVTVFLDTTQLTNAARIIATGRENGVPPLGLKVAVMTALQESGLRMLANDSVPESLEYPNDGTGSDHDSVNFFQQRPSSGWGSVKQLMDPAYAARAFFGGKDGPNKGSPKGLLDVEDWESLAPGVAAQAVQVSRYPDAYDKWEGAAESIINEIGDSISCEAGAGIDADAQQVARTLTDAMDEGKLSVVGDYAIQVRRMAAGDPREGCSIDIAILQVIAFTLQQFETVTVSSLNRRCTGSTPGAGTRSYHWKGQAVDFSVLDDQLATGADANSLELVKLLDPIVPAGLAGVGQSNCRMEQGEPIFFQHFIQFPDSCNHLHVEVRTAGKPLNFSST